MSFVKLLKRIVLALYSVYISTVSLSSEPVRVQITVEELLPKLALKHKPTKVL